MKQITLEEYNKKPADYRGVWTTERWDDLGWGRVRHKYMGKRTILDMDENTGATVLLIEGLSFEIID